MNTWRLPGPSAFLDQAIKALEDGQNVLVPHVAHMPRRPARAIHDRILENRRLASLTHVPIRRLKARPLEWLRDQVAGSSTGHSRPVTAAEVAFHESTRRRVYHVDNMAEDVWPAWMDFLTAVSEASHAVDAQERVRFVVTVPPFKRLDGPRSSPTLRVLAWRGTIGPLDTMTLVDSILPRDTTGIARLVDTSVITEICLWDLEAARELAARPSGDFEAPAKFLENLVERRAWDKAVLASPSHPDAIQTGVVEHFGGRDRLHSACLLHGRRDRLARRVWRGQMRTLFPWVEELAHDLMCKLEQYLQFPCDLDDRVFSTAADMEINHLCRLMPRTVPPRDQQLARRLRKLRNDLAHMDVVKRDDWMHSDLLKWSNRVLGPPGSVLT